MVEIHRITFTAKRWALITGIAFVICLGFGIVDAVRSAPDTATETTTEASE